MFLTFIGGLGEQTNLFGCGQKRALPTTVPDTALRLPAHRDGRQWPVMGRERNSVPSGYSLCRGISNNAAE